MSDLPGRWTPLRGVSCAGWDIMAATNSVQLEGERFAIFRRRIGEETYTKGKVHPTLSSVTAGIDELQRQFVAGKYEAEDLFPMENLPNFGAFC